MAVKVVSSALSYDERNPIMSTTTTKHRKRANGEGTVYEDARANRWVGEVMHAGKRRRVYGKTKRAASAALNDLRQRLNTGAVQVDARLTVAQLGAQWLDVHVSAR